MSIVFVLPNVPNPRINKRIAIAKKKTETKVLCVRRASQNIWEPYHSDVEHIIYDVDLPTSDHIFKRFILSSHFHNVACKRLETMQPALIYADGFDALCIACKYKRKYKELKIVYEMADIREGFIEKSKSLIKRIGNFVLRYSEKVKIQNIDYLIVTSEKFYEVYYRNMLKKEKVLYAPNTPDSQYFENYHRKKCGKFTIGFIGGIRYLPQMKMLVDAAGKTNVNVLFAGAGGTSADYTSIKDYCEDKGYIKFTGRYDYAKEIADLYSKVDCVYAVYDASNANVRIALPNKLYESILCELPIIVAKDTYLSEVVETWGVGAAVRYDNINDLVYIIEKLANDKDYYNNIRKNCHAHQKDIDVENCNKKIKEVFNKLLDL